MIDILSKYFDKNPIIGYILIIILLIILLKLTSVKLTSVKNNEYMENINLNDIFNKYYTNKKLNLKCIYNNKNYYLVTVPVSDITGLSSDITEDCSNSIVILMDEDIINAKLSDYNKTLEINKEMCNSNENILCKHQINGVCQETYDKCQQNRIFYTDFIAETIKNTPNKYLFRGTNNISIYNVSKNTILNQKLFTTYGNNKLCGDDYPYGDSVEYNNFAEIMLDEIKLNSTNINENIQSSQETIPNIKFKLAFNTDIIIKRTDVNKKTIYNKISDSSNNLKQFKSFLGASSDFITFDNNKYRRVYLYDTNDLSNYDRFLEFQPIII